VKSPAYIRKSIRKEIRKSRNCKRYRNMYRSSVRRKNLLSPRQMYPNRTSVQPFIMATSHTATDSFKGYKCAGSEGSESDNIGKFVAGPLPSFALLSNDLATTNFKIITRWKCCCTKCGDTGLALISAANGKVRLTTCYGSERGKT